MDSMKNPAASHLLGVGLALAGFAACQTTAPDSTPPAETTPAVTATIDASPAPMELDDAQLSAWNYLAEKYDADGDGRITSDECDRDNLERLDRDGDGVLTADDYAGSGAMMASIMVGMRAQAAVFVYFQADDEVATLNREELSWSFSEYDDDHDGKVTEEEFDALAEVKEVEIPSEYGLGRTMTGDFQPWTALVEGIDGDEDLVLSSTEIESFYDERDDGDGVWTLQSRTRPSSVAEDRGEPVSGAKVGTVAPDFTLTSPEGGEAVTLSSFKGKQPVALIFGSYT
jgi:Ca2+-binding EF-hand superfamily protein